MKSPESFAAFKPRQPDNKEDKKPPSGAQERILGQFSPEEQKLIRERMRALSLIPNHVGKDFDMEVGLNEPGRGWHWNFAENHVRADPQDLLEKPLDYCRHVMGHEGFHRRISRVEGIVPEDEWRQPGFAAMMNSIEDPRIENFGAEAYPPYKKLAHSSYEHDFEKEKKAKEEAGKTLGRHPRFMQAGFEYIRQWFRQAQGGEFELSADLPQDVREMVEKTLEAAEDSWQRYPTRQEADQSEALVEAYAKKSYEINRDRVWPEFKKLVEEDVKDQELSEFVKDMQKGEGGGAGAGKEGEGQGSLSEKDMQDIKDALAGGGEGEVVPFDALSEELKQKIRAAIDALPEDKKRELAEAARAAIQEASDKMAETLAGEYIKAGEPEAEPKTPAPEGGAWSEAERAAQEGRREMRRRMEESLERGEGDPYQKALGEMAPYIDTLTGDLRDVFVKRKLAKTESGYRSGRRWNVRARIRERIAGIPLIKTQSREQPESPGQEADYAVLLQVDLSGSMQGIKMREAFKSAVLLGETLNNLGIRFEIDGFQDMLLEFKRFDEELDDAMRAKLNQLPLEANNKNPGGHNRAQDNDDGACLRAASEHLAGQTAREKVLIVLSDGAPETRNKSRMQLDRELKEAVAHISQNTDQKLIGVGINSSAVSRYYEHNLPDVDARELAETLGELLRGVIERG